MTDQTDQAQEELQGMWQAKRQLAERNAELCDQRQQAIDALREIDTPVQMPGTYFDNMAGQAEWWKHIAAKRREIAADALVKLGEQP